MPTASPTSASEVSVCKLQTQRPVSRGAGLLLLNKEAKIVLIELFHLLFHLLPVILAALGIYLVYQNVAGK